MAYLGNNLQAAYSSYLLIDSLSASFNGTTTSFALKVNGVAPVPFPLNEQNVLISVGGIPQKPDPTGAEGFKFSGTNIVFSSAPKTGESFWGVVLAGADYVNVGVTYPDGDASTPSITFNSTKTTGLYLAGSSTLGFATAGVLRLTIDSNGNLSVLSTGSATAPSIVVGTGTTYAPGIYSPGTDQFGISTSGINRLLADGNGCITVGTSTGTTKPIWFTSLDSQTTLNTSNINFLCQPPAIINADAITTTTTYTPVIFANALTSSSSSIATLIGMRIASNVAATAAAASASATGLQVGTYRTSVTDAATGSTPGALIGVQNIVATDITLPVTSKINSMTGCVSTVLFTQGTVISAVQGFQTTLTTQGTSNATASSPACVCYIATNTVGTTSGTGTGVVTDITGYRTVLNVRTTGTVTNYYGIDLQTPVVSGTLTNRWSIYSRDASSPMYHAGSIGIGTTAPAYQLQLSTDSAGKPSTNTWTIVSDERIKEDIELANLDLCYEAVKNIPLKRFKWKDKVYSAEQVGDRRKLGWIAQDVEAVFPKAVRIKEFKYNQKFKETFIPAIKEKLGRDGTVIIEGQPERIEKKLISEDVIEDCRDLNADQLYAAMYGTIQKLISKVETLEAKVAILGVG